MQLRQTRACARDPAWPQPSGPAPPPTALAASSAWGPEGARSADAGLPSSCCCAAPTSPLAPAWSPRAATSPPRAALRDQPVGRCGRGQRRTAGATTPHATLSISASVLQKIFDGSRLRADVDIQPLAPARTGRIPPPRDPRRPQRKVGDALANGVRDTNQRPPSARSSPKPSAACAWPNCVTAKARKARHGTPCPAHPVRVAGTNSPSRAWPDSPLQ